MTNVRVPFMRRDFILTMIACICLWGCATPDINADRQPDSFLNEFDARKDLEFIREQILRHHPGPVNDLDPSFKENLEKNFLITQEELKSSSFFPEKYFQILKYIAAFRDPHLNLSFINADSMDLYLPAQWPGFIMSKVGKNFKVKYVSEEFFSSDVPPLNATLESCDGRLVKKIFEDNIFPFYGDPSLPAHYFTHAWRLFWYNGNPLIKKPGKCVFRIEGEKKEFFLKWMPYRIADFRKGPLRQAGFFADKPFSLVSFNDGAWVTIPTFSPSTADEEHVKELATQVQNLKNPSFIVFDLRGNSGGDSTWGDLFLKSALGEQALERLPVDSDYVEYRVSTANLNHWKSVVERQKKIFGQAEYFSRVVKEMEKALSENRSLIKIDEDQGKKHVSGNVTLKPHFSIYLLTDGFCYSACLNFLDQALKLGAIQIGQETGADTNYMDVRQVNLPSGLFSLTLPLKVYRGRARKNKQYFTPNANYYWDGDISNTEELKQWVVQFKQ